jgi:hypothetical protein
VASSSEAMRLLELFELQAQEGPCLDAFHTGEPVERRILVAGSGPWPSFSVAAIKAGFRSGFATPLRWRDVTLGAPSRRRRQPQSERMASDSYPTEGVTASRPPAAALTYPGGR